MKIAILILAHKNENQLKKLIDHLATNFDVFVNIDKKSKIKLDDKLFKESNSIVKIFKKYKVYWGSYNQILSTIFLYRKASEIGYDRYILISGQDVPIKSNAEIMDFFTKNKNCEFLESGKLPLSCWSKGGIDRLNVYHKISYRGVYGEDKWFVDFNNYFVGFINYLTNNKPIRKINYEFHGGANWTNLTKECVEYILNYIDNNDDYLKRFKHTICGDEIFFQTIIANMNGGNNIVSETLRYIDLEKGPDYPRTLTSEDFSKIMDSPALFARKFDESIDNGVISKIYDNLEK